MITTLETQRSPGWPATFAQGRRDKDFPTYPNACSARYAHTIVGCKGIGTNGASMVHFERAPGHYREDATCDFALVMIQNGGFAAELDLGAGRFSTTVTPGQFFLSPPFTATDYEFQGRAKGLVLAIAHATLAKLMPSLDLKMTTGFRALYTRPLSDDFIRVAVNQLSSGVCASDRDDLFVDTTILAIFAALARHGKYKAATEAKRGLAAWQLRRVMEKLESLQETSLSELAASANLSPFYFARAFKHTTGLPPHHYQLRLRIERAKELLTRSRLPITEVALRVGYGSSQTLARVFRKDVGTSPALYRRSTAC